MVGSAVPAIPAGAALGGGFMEERDVHLLAVGAGIARPHWVREPSVRASSSARAILRRSSRSDAAAQRLGFGRPNEGLNAHGMFAGQRPSCAATCTANGPGPVAPPRSGPAVSIVVSDASSAMRRLCIVVGFRTVTRKQLRQLGFSLRIIAAASR